MSGDKNYDLVTKKENSDIGRSGQISAVGRATHEELCIVELPDGNKMTVGHDRIAKIMATQSLLHQDFRGDAVKILEEFNPGDVVRSRITEALGNINQLISNVEFNGNGSPLGSTLTINRPPHSLIAFELLVDEKGNLKIVQKEKVKREFRREYGGWGTDEGVMGDPMPSIVSDDYFATRD